MKHNMYNVVYTGEWYIYKGELFLGIYTQQGLTSVYGDKVISNKAWYNLYLVNTHRVENVRVGVKSYWHTPIYVSEDDFVEFNQCGGVYDQ